MGSRAHARKLSTIVAFFRNMIASAGSTDK